MEPYVKSDQPYVVPNVEEGSTNSKEFLNPNTQSAPETSEGDAPTESFMDRISKAFNDWYQRERTSAERRNRLICCSVFGVAVFITGLGVLIASLGKVEETSFGVQYNIHRKQLDDAALSGGLFFGPPGYQFIKFPSTFIGVDFVDRTCVSRDGLRVVFSVTFQYQMIEENVLPAIVKYRDFGRWANIVEAAGLSAIHHSCGNYVISDFQNKRGEIQSNMEDNLRLKLEGDTNSTSSDKEGVFAQVVSLQLQNIELPDEYNNAVQEKQSAEEDIALAENERNQETTKARTELLTSVEEARKILDSANNDAEVLLEEARLKAEETTFAFSKQAERLVQVKNSLGLTTEGVLAYMYNTLLSEVDDLKITSGEPAKLSRSDEL